LINLSNVCGIKIPRKCNLRDSGSLYRLTEREL
jgi:hypothetical protein